MTGKLPVIANSSEEKEAIVLGTKFRQKIGIFRKFVYRNRSQSIPNPQPEDTRSHIMYVYLFSS